MVDEPEVWICDFYYHIYIDFLGDLSYRDQPESKLRRTGPGHWPDTCDHLITTGAMVCHQAIDIHSLDDWFPYIIPGRLRKFGHAAYFHVALVG